MKDSGIYKQTTVDNLSSQVNLMPFARRMLSSYSSLAELLGKTAAEDALSEDFKKYLFELESKLTTYFGIDSEIDKMRLEMANFSS